MDLLRFAREELAPVLAMIEGRPGERVAMILVAATLAESLGSDEFDTATHATRIALAEYAAAGRTLN